MTQKKVTYGLLTVLLLCFGPIRAQQGIGTNEPSRATALELKAKTKGLLIPRVELTNLTVFAPISGESETDADKVNSLLVYNTTTDPTEELAPGYYYWTTDGASGKWHRLLMDTDDVGIEPWFKQGSTEKATANTDDIFQRGNVSIGKDAPNFHGGLQPRLYVDGAVRGGSPKTSAILGENSLAIVGENSLAIGKDVIASGKGAVALGHSTNAKGENSVAMGHRASAGGENSVAMGDQAAATEESAFAMGLQVKAKAPYATAIGAINTATGQSSLALNQKTTASGMYSTSMGFGSTASGNHALATGNGTTASGGSSFSAGSSTRARGDYSVALGYKTKATGNFSVAIGNETTAAGYQSVSIGKNTSATSDNSVAMGLKNEASGKSSLVAGRDNKAFGHYATAFGRQNRASTAYESVFGRYNALHTVNGPHRYNWFSKDPLFQIGNGDSDTNRHNAVTVLKNGWVGIGYTDPSGYTNNGPKELLRINGSVRISGAYHGTYSIFPDYVFEQYFDHHSDLDPDYTFKSLELVEAFIKKHKHLPGIEPASALNRTKDGKYEFNMTNLTLNSLEKIEELFLHAIEQAKEIKTLKKEVKRLKQHNRENDKRLNRLENVLKNK